MDSKIIPIETLIKEQARTLGFSLCGISNVKVLETCGERLKLNIESGYHAEMTYLERNSEVRKNPALLVENAQSVISLALNYYPGEVNFNESYGISKYALGEDYHLVMKEKLTELLDYITKYVPECNGRCFVDTAPIFEKAWAQESGLGFVGKHTLIITKEFGTFVFLGEIVVDIPLIADSKRAEDLCGECTQCMDACPTGALCAPYTLDARKCIAYLTIEHKGEIDSSLKAKFGNQLYGCDLCQMACPWNASPTQTEEKRFLPSSSLVSLKKVDWRMMDEATFDQLFKNSPIKRVKLSGIRRNMNN